MLTLRDAHMVDTDNDVDLVVSDDHHNLNPTTIGKPNTIGGCGLFVYRHSMGSLIELGQHHDDTLFVASSSALAESIPTPSLGFDSCSCPARPALVITTAMNYTALTLWTF